jgi:CheY-like chemotaxis protein
LKLYRSIRDIRWFAFGSKLGWVSFPAEVGGWQKRQPAGDVDRGDMREVPLLMGFNTGIPGAPMSSALFSVPKRKTNHRPLPTMRRRDNRETVMKTILVLGDETTIVTPVRLMLSQYNLIEASTAQQALRLFTEHDDQVDLLVADLTLSRSAGIQFALFLRSKIPDLPVVLTTGYPVGDWTVRDYLDFRRLGPTSVVLLARPFPVQKLLHTVRELAGAVPSGIAKTA